MTEHKNMTYIDFDNIGKKTFPKML